MPRLAALRFHIEGFHPDLLPSLVRLDAESFPHDAWSADVFRKSLGRPGLTVRLAVANRTVIGYAMIQTRGEAWGEILSLAVRRDQRRKGLGRDLLDDAWRECPQFSRLTIRIRETNEIASAFLSRCDFRAFKVLRDFYKKPNEDAFLFSGERPFYAGP